MIMMMAKNDVSTLIMAALRKLIHTSAQNEGDKEVMTRYAENCIVALFNVYMDSSDKSARSAAAETVKVSGFLQHEISVSYGIRNSTVSHFELMKF